MMRLLLLVQEVKEEMFGGEFVEVTFKEAYPDIKNFNDEYYNKICLVTF